MMSDDVRQPATNVSSFICKSKWPTWWTSWWWWCCCCCCCWCWGGWWKMAWRTALPVTWSRWQKILQNDLIWSETEFRHYKDGSKWVLSMLLIPFLWVLLIKFIKDDKKVLTWSRFWKELFCFRGFLMMHDFFMPPDKFGQKNCQPDSRFADR